MDDQVYRSQQVSLPVVAARVVQHIRDRAVLDRWMEEPVGRPRQDHNIRLYHLLLSTPKA
jgi:hypothetical protein